MHMLLLGLGNLCASGRRLEPVILENVRFAAVANGRKDQVCLVSRLMLLLNYQQVATDALV
jgi:hypothetical protein